MLPNVFYVPQSIALGKASTYSDEEKIYHNKTCAYVFVVDGVLNHYKRHTPLVTHICVTKSLNKCCYGLY
jgi:hypothetical protein